MGNCVSKDPISQTTIQQVPTAVSNAQQPGEQIPSTATTVNTTSNTNAPPPPPPPPIIVNKSLPPNPYPTISHELRWRHLHTNYVSKIVDPADIHSVLDECLASTIKNLHSAEMTLLLRRVRKVVRKVLTSDSKHNGRRGRGGNDGISSSGGLISNGYGNSNSNGSGHYKYNTNNIDTKSKSYPASSSSSSGILKGSKGYKSSKYSNRNDKMHTSSSSSSAASGSSVSEQIRSKTTYQKDHVLDEYLMKQIFMGGNQLLKLGAEKEWVEKSLVMYQTRLKGRKTNASWGRIVNSIDNNRNQQVDGDYDGGDNGHLNGMNGDHKDSHVVINDQSDVGISESTYVSMNGHGRTHNSKSSNNNEPVTSIPSSSIPSSKQPHNKNSSRKNRRSANRNNHNTNSNHNNNNNNNLKPKSPSSVADIFGSAFHILLYLSEKRWDHVTDIARISAQNANLTLDVNEQINVMDQKRSANNNNDATNHSSSPSSPASSSSIPLPPPEYPSNETYADLPPTSPLPLPSGITLQEVSFLVATALRSSRRKTLMLLFYLLLDRETLIELMESHPGGGLPTWLLEMDNDWILSYASLSHYYYYGGSPSPSLSSYRNGKHMNGSSKASLSGGINSNSDTTKELKVDRLTAIETIGVLLHYAPPKSLLDDNDDQNNDDKVDYSNDSKTITTKVGDKINDLPSNILKRERTLSYGDKKYHAAKMHVMLADYLRQLQENSGEAPLFENEAEQFWRLETLDVFWDASHSQYTKCKCDKNKRDSSQKDQNLTALWTIEEFMTWANEAIPEDASLDLIMHQLFGLGLLPTPAMERQLVSESWVDWQIKEPSYFNSVGKKISDPISIMSIGIENLLTLPPSRDMDLSHSEGLKNGHIDSGVLSFDGSAVWGGIGGFDGRGGLGNGVLYCVDKEWWDQWSRYVGWEWSDGSSEHGTHKRPHDLSTEKLLDQNSDFIIRGTQGSYELMKKYLKKDVDYVLVPPRVWDILYELYGGGPPLPRMIIKIEDSKPIADNVSIDITPWQQLVEKPMKIPRLLNVVTHPWVLECRVCDPHQPYRRGHVGHMSIRIMVTNYQPLWRLFAEVVLRLPIIHPRGKNSKGKGCARLWKRLKEEIPSQNTSGVTRYGPWELLQKRGSADFPVGENLNIDSEIYDPFQQSWESYADECTIESVGLCDGDKMMFEYALVGKDGNFTWPREAAAKAGKLQRDNDEENTFRRKLRGLDAAGNLVKNIKSLVGTVIDAMDPSGRWYQAEITDVDTSSKQSADVESDDETYGSEVVEEKSETQSGEVKAIRVDFSDVGGEEEWINISSDRLAAHKRFTLDSMKSLDQLDTGKKNKEGNGYPKPSSLIVLRKHNTKQPSTFQHKTSICSYPGFGACGLYNLGNTCYANSALQCITYMPLLRSYLLSGKFKRNGDVNRDNPLGTGGKVLEAFAELLRDMWSGKSGAMQPLRFKMCLARAKRRYIGSEQQDSQELLNDMLDVLHEDSNKVVKKPYVEALEDAWVDKTNLARVGEETWRRYLRRNRSIIADICMGQVLNRVTCPSCNHTSRIFEPFNMLSLPFPNVTEVLFRCILIRRATPLNCIKTLSFSDDINNRSHRPPSKQLIAEEYVIPMSRVTDIRELKIQLVKIAGITKERLKLYNVVDGEISSMTSNEIISLSLLADEKNGPCWHFAQTDKSDETTNHTTSIVAFETTLNPRPEHNTNIVMGYDSSGKGNTPTLGEGVKVQNKILIEDTLRIYGDESECRLYDTNPLPLAKAMSRIMWPTSAPDLAVGLRVDAIDHRSNWYPGTIVEVSRTENDTERSTKTLKMKVKIHFDNYSTKWDLIYSLDDIRGGKVQPLYSHSRPKDKPLEMQLFHSQNYDPLILFGFPFFIHFHIEWSNARAGAHILSQASRYLEGEPQKLLLDDEKNILSFSSIDTKDSDVHRKCEVTRNIISKAIDVLIKDDRRYIDLIMSRSQNNKSELEAEVATLSSRLERKMAMLLPLMPFNIVIYDQAPHKSADEKSGSKTIPFEFKLDRTIGNCMNARQEIIICWKEVKKSSIRNPISYFSPPKLNVHRQSNEFLKKRQIHITEVNGGNAQNGMSLGSCLDEFCNEQQLDQSECWRCPKCKELREGRQRMNLWRLPDVLTFHLKRFNCSALWREKITNTVNFPLTGLDMKEWCDKQSPVLQGSDDNCVYDLIGVVNHYGGMTSGHYTAVSKATACSPGGSEEVEHYFNGAGVHAFGGADEKDVQPALWKLIRSKEKDANNMQSRAAQASAKSAAESSEPLWLQFDDESVEPIPPSEVVSQMAYVLFYRRRRISPSNIAKYSTIE